tara:strand:- start:360 stop:1481 length:1122 start_codon:yes stop_codon:yes gene_type:complete
MIKEYTSLGLMSGTSADGIDASIIQSDGDSYYKVIKDKYFEYSEEIYQNIHNLREKIQNINDLKNFDKEIVILEREITLFHSRVIKEISENQKIDIVGFHGQTIYHNPQEKISKQLGDGNLLSQLTKKNIVYNFRQNDIENDGEGAPLTPIFHQLLASQYNIGLPVCILNIGGISNITIVKEPTGSSGFTSRDIGPGNCMIDAWVRKNSNQSFDKDGILASKGTRNVIIYEQGQELFSNRPNQNISSLDVNDFDVSFARGLSLEDGASTLTDLTSNIIGATLSSLLLKEKKKFLKVLICGGGRKNHILIDKIKENSSKDIAFLPIDDCGVDGDFIESQAFAFLAIRSKLNLPISFPDTTGCKSPSVGGTVVEY